MSKEREEPVVWQVIGIAGFMYLYNKPRDEVYEHHRVVPLYTAPPKPLTPREGLEEYKRGYAQAQLDLKREPLSEEAVGELLMSGFSTHLMDLVRMVEKAHGITGGGE